MPSRIFMICHAYESGFGHGLAGDGLDLAGDGLDLAGDGLDLSQTPHSEPELGEAYQLGYDEGRRRLNQGALEVIPPVLADLALYFKSGNSVPVERATIRTDDFWKIVNRQFHSRTTHFSLLWMRYGWKRFFTRDWWALFLRGGN